MWTDLQLAQLKIRNGFRLRGGELTRLESLTDGAFALALTFLLITQQAVPQTFDELLADFSQIPAFAASFSILLLFWRSHVRWSRRYGLEDATAIALTGVMIFTVLVFVYPLKIVFASFFAQFIGNPHTGPDMFRTYEQLRQLFVLYGLGFMLLQLTLWGLYAYALGCADDLRLNRLERFDTRASAVGNLIGAGIAALSTAAALLLPATAAGLSGYVYALFMIVLPIYWRRVRRRRAVLPPTDSKS